MLYWKSMKKRFASCFCVQIFSQVGDDRLIILHQKYFYHNRTSAYILII